jgi:hypothetical protein
MKGDLQPKSLLEGADVGAPNTNLVLDGPGSCPTASAGSSVVRLLTSDEGESTGLSKSDKPSSGAGFTGLKSSVTMSHTRESPESATIAAGKSPCTKSMTGTVFAVDAVDPNTDDDVVTFRCLKPRTFPCNSATFKPNSNPSRSTS